MDGYAKLVDELDQRCRLQFLFSNPQSLFHGLHVGYVATSTGHLTFSRRDLVILDSTPLVLARVYDSRQLRDSGLGPGWRLNLQQSIEFDQGYVVFNEANGHALRFTLREGDRFVPTVITPRTQGVTLQLYGDTAVIEYMDGSRKTFRKHPELALLQLTEIDFGMGYPIQLDYDQGRLARVSQRNKTLLTLGWQHNRLITLTDSHQRSVVYTYDEQNRLAEVIDVAGQTWSYQYDEHHRLQYAAYPNTETYLQVTYDQRGRVDYLQGTKDFDFSYSEGFTEVRIGNGPTRTFHLNEEGVTIGYQMGSEYQWTIELDPQNKPELINKHNEELRLNYGQDSSWIQHPYGWMRLTRDSENRVYQYDGSHPQGQLVYTISETTENQIQVNNHQIGLSYVLRQDGQIEKLMHEERTYQLDYDEHAFLAGISLDDKNMRFARDEQNRVIETRYHNGRISEYDYDRLGNRVQAHYLNGTTMMLQHDGRGNITQVVDKLHSGESLIQNYQINTKNQVQRIEFPNGIDLDVDYDADGRTVQFTMDGKQVHIYYNAQSEIERLQSGYLTWTPSQPFKDGTFSSPAPNARALLHNDRLQEEQPNYGNVSFDHQTLEIHVIHPNDWLIPGYTKANQALLTIQSWLKEDEPQLLFEKPSNPVFQPPEYLSTNCCTNCSMFNPNCGQLCINFYGIQGDYSCNCQIMLYNRLPNRSSGGGGPRSCSRKDKGQEPTARDTIEDVLGELKPAPYEKGGRVDCTDLKEFKWSASNENPKHYCVTLQANVNKTVYLGHTHPFFDPEEAGEDGIRRVCCDESSRCEYVVSASQRRLLNDENEKCSEKDKEIGARYPLLMKTPLTGRFVKC